MTARIDLCLVESWSPVGFENGVFTTALSLQKSFNSDLLVGASSGCRDAFKAILSTSFFCGYGLAVILWRLCFVIVPCSVGAVRGHGTVALKIEFWFLLRWHVTARADVCLA